MSKKIASILALSMFMAVPAASGFASERENVSDEAAKKIHAVLEAQGYMVDEIEAEDDGFEAEVTKDGKEFEVVLNQAFEIVEIEQEDDD